jgi:hypothetical protein
MISSSVRRSTAAGIDFRGRMGGSDDTVDQVGEAVAPPIAAGLSRMKT